MNVINTQAPAKVGNVNDDAYGGYMQRLQARFEANVAGGTVPVFNTNAAGLWELYLNSVPQTERQYHNCNCCQEFIKRYGGLAVVAPDGSLVPAFWNEDDACDGEKEAAAALAKAVRGASITSVFLSELPRLGDAVTGVWRHLALTQPEAMVWKHPIDTAYQASAKKTVEFGIVLQALDEFSKPVVEQALGLLRAEALANGQAVLGQAEFLHSIHSSMETVKSGRARRHLVWRAVAKAPAGFCHPRGTMVGNLLDELKSGAPFEAVAQRFKVKMDATKYRRPTAAPTAGAVDAAEKLVAQLGVEPAFPRRTARLDELEAIWTPAPVREEQSTGLFGHLKPAAKAEVGTLKVPVITMSVDKFRRTVLPSAEKVEVYLGRGPQALAVFTTAVHSEAPNLFQWGHPVNWYQWTNGSTPQQMSLSPGWSEVKAVTLDPPSWFGKEGKFTHLPPGLFFVLAGGRETRNPGAALFPADLRSDMHEISRVVESYSKQALLQGLDVPHAVGLVVGKPPSTAEPRIQARLQVTVGTIVTEYALDRWD